MHNQTVYVLIGRRRRSYVTDIEFLEELTVILTIVWWLQKLEGDIW